MQQIDRQIDGQNNGQIDGQINASIYYRTNPSKPQITRSELFADKTAAQNWIKKTYAEIENQYSPLKPAYKLLANEYEQIMKEHSDGKIDLIIFDNLKKLIFLNCQRFIKIIFTKAIFSL